MEGTYPEEDPYYKNKQLHRVRYGNLFDGDITFSFVGFRTGLIVITIIFWKSSNKALHFLADVCS